VEDVVLDELAYGKRAEVDEVETEEVAIELLSG